MDKIFDVCVYLLECLSAVTGFTYKELNVYIFVFIHPLITLVLFIMLVKAKTRLRSYEKNKI
jgi:hypothetical protein